MTNLRWILPALAVLGVLAGCGYFEQPKDRLSMEPQPFTKALPNNYYAVKVNESTAAEVLENISRPEKEVLNQTENVVLTHGTKKNGHQLWFAAVAFDDESMVAKRKYFFHTDEKSYHINAEDQKLYIDMVLDMPEQVYDETYTSADVKHVEIFKGVYERFREDTRDLTVENQQFESCTLMVNQVFNSLLHQLSLQRDLVRKMVGDKGLRFDHMNYDGGRVRMVITDSVVHVRVLVGYKPWGFEWGLDVTDMDDPPPAWP